MRRSRTDASRPGGFLDATSDTTRIASWWTAATNANVGIACAASHLVVVDIDPRNGGDDTLVELARELGPVPATWTVLTPGGGAHYYLQYAGDDVVGALGRGVDIKHRGYVVAPPSVHPNGGVYRWDLGAHPLEAAIARVPDRWRARLRLAARAARPISSNIDARESFLGVAFASLGWLGISLRDGRRFARCPWAGEHSDGRGRGGDSSSILFPRGVRSTLGGFVCSHAHCAGRRVRDVIRALPPDAIDAGARAFPDAYRGILWRLSTSRRSSP
jgi:hypothetical protein